MCRRQHCGSSRQAVGTVRSKHCVDKPHQQCLGKAVLQDRRLPGSDYCTRCRRIWHHHSTRMPAHVKHLNTCTGSTDPVALVPPSVQSARMRSKPRVRTQVQRIGERVSARHRQHTCDIKARWSARVSGLARPLTRSGIGRSQDAEVPGKVAARNTSTAAHRTCILQSVTSSAESACGACSEDIVADITGGNLDHAGGNGHRATRRQTASKQRDDKVARTQRPPSAHS